MFGKSASLFQTQLGSVSGSISRLLGRSYFRQMHLVRVRNLGNPENFLGLCKGDEKYRRRNSTATFTGLNTLKWDGTRGHFGNLYIGNIKLPMPLQNA